ncbi:MAG: alpha/beta hydrolase [SAR202 cluster bacterium]|nr:alpha/beta hydrolase [SAR202 cluster bacterium]|tara:strand:- start:976 stop:1845 length:870 start_codon:yes stop_codon:yes gene_type:complete
MTNPYYPEDKWVTVNGLRIHYLDYGGDRTKRPLILLHGLGGNAHTWDKLAPHFAETHHVVAMDARGCGDSDWSKDGYSVQQDAADVGEFAKATGLYPFDYYGHSQGSRYGMPVGAYFGEYVEHLVLGDYGPMPDLSPAGRETAAKRQASGAAAERPKGFFSPEQAFDWHRQADETLADDELWDLVKNTYRTNWDGILIPKTDPEIQWLNGRAALKEGEFLWDSVSKISCKTLVLRGEVSTVLNREMAEEMVAKMPDGNGSLIEVPGAGHGLHGENMEGTVQILREFFAS